MRPRILGFAIALGAITASACDSSLDPIIGGLPPRPDSTADSATARRTTSPDRLAQPARLDQH
jgi:hypothetical protein